MKKPFSAAEMDELKKIIKEANGKIFDPLKEIDVIVKSRFFIVFDKF